MLLKVVAGEALESSRRELMRLLTNHLVLPAIEWWAAQESNLDLCVRSATSYPLNEQPI